MYIYRYSGYIACTITSIYIHNTRSTFTLCVFCVLSRCIFCHCCIHWKCCFCHTPTRPQIPFKFSGWTNCKYSSSYNNDEGKRRRQMPDSDYSFHLFQFCFFLSIFLHRKFLIWPSIRSQVLINGQPCYLVVVNGDGEPFPRLNRHRINDDRPMFLYIPTHLLYHVMPIWIVTLSDSKINQNGNLFLKAYFGSPKTILEKKSFTVFEIQWDKVAEFFWPIPQSKIGMTENSDPEMVSLESDRRSHFANLWIHISKTV